MEVGDELTNAELQNCRTGFLREKKSDVSEEKHLKSQISWQINLFGARSCVCPRKELLRSQSVAIPVGVAEVEMVRKN